MLRLMKSVDDREDTTPEVLPSDDLQEAATRLLSSLDAPSDGQESGATTSNKDNESGGAEHHRRHPYSPLFKPLTAKQILEEASPDIPWLWEPFIPEGALTLLMAHPKAGKSTFMTPLTISLARGADFLETPVRRTPVLWCGVEEKPGDTKRRFQQFGLLETDSLELLPGMMPRKEFFRDLDTYLGEKRCGLVVVDTLSTFWSGVKENEVEAVSPILNEFLRLARRHNTTIVLIYHARKGAADHFVNAVRGSSAIAGIVDQILNFEHPAGKAKNVRKIESSGRYGQSELFMELNGAVYSPVEDAGPDRTEEVFAALTDTGQTVDDLHGATGISESGLRRFLKKLESIGRVVRSTNAGRGLTYLYARAQAPAPPQASPDPPGAG